LRGGLRGGVLGSGHELPLDLDLKNLTLGFLDPLTGLLSRCRLFLIYQ